MDGFNAYLMTKGCRDGEGHIGHVPQQQIALKNLVAARCVTKIMEIGFNAGHSAVLMLEANTDATVVSFDISEYSCVSMGKEYVDHTYPGRHELVVGDSKSTVPSFITQNPNTKFDVIFIDGGHSYQDAITDLMNCKSLAHENTIVMIDDIMFNPEWQLSYNIGPTRAWGEMIQKGHITEITHNDVSYGRGYAIGKYILFHQR